MHLQSYLGGLGRFLPCSLGSHLSRFGHVGWNQCSHGLNSRPLESCHHQCLKAVCGVLEYPQGSAVDLSDGTLKLRHCTEVFTMRFPHWSLPKVGYGVGKRHVITPGHFLDAETQVWNRGGVVPVGIEQLTRLARRVKPDAVVWRGDTDLPLSQQGIRVLGVPIGQPEFVRHFLEKKNQEHQTLFQRIPWLNDPEAAWLLLLMCGSPRAIFWLRAVRPELTDSLAVRHDEDVWSCMRTILGSRHPAIAEMMITHTGGGTAPCFQAVRECQQSLEDAGFNIPSWRELAKSPPQCGRQTQSPVAAEGHSEVGATVRARGGVAWFGRSHEGSASFPTRSSGLSSIDNSAHVSGHTD